MTSSRRLHVLGMGKPFLDLRGTNGPKLELDFLRLAYVVRGLLAAKANAVGYLAVLDEKVGATASTWIEKYHSGDHISILYIIPKWPDLDWLATENVDTGTGVLPERFLANYERNLAIANFGRDLGEKHLKEAIEERHPGIIPSTKLPLSIAWDFYGTVPPETNA